MRGQIPHQQSGGGAKQGVDAPQINAKSLKCNHGRVEFGAQAYVDVADMLIRCTRYGPETERFLQLLRRLEQGRNSAWHIRRRA